MVRAALAGLVVVAACQGGGRDQPTAGSASAVPPPGAEAGFGAPPPLDDALDVTEDAPLKIEDPEPADPGKLIAELGAIPAWEAVIDRAQLLGRRGQHGVVFGTIGPTVMVPAPPVAAGSTGSAAGSAAGPTTVASPYVWFVDDTEGNGTLGIRVLLGKQAAKLGDRVALGGAWQLDDQRRWFWKVDGLTPVPPGPPSDLEDPPVAIPSHEIATGNLAPGARTISVARDNDAVYFQIVGPPPVTDGDGWLVANELGDAPFARLTLPGERASYGGQDMRAADERWQLRRAQTYWVRIGKIRRYARADDPVGMRARTAPVRVN